MKTNLKLAGAMGLGILYAASAWANFQGALYTTIIGGTTVNGNIYQNKADVYLSGGPQLHGATCGGVSLTNGTYYFKVTNPNGSLDLSINNDAVAVRSFTVTAGVWTNVSGGHSTGTSPCLQGITIALAPFDDTDNPGGEYKVWLSTNPAFPNDQTKTDNFKVVNAGCVVICDPPPPQSIITGFKFYDTNGNGQFDASDFKIPGWQIAAAGSAVDSKNPTFTDVSGTYSFTVDNSTGDYTISEVFPMAPVSGPQWVATTAITGIASSTLDVNSGPNFGNICVGNPGNALTLGFWSNKNGEALMTGTATGTTIKDPAYSALSALALVNGAGNPAGFGSNYKSFNTWILGATATNMAYMLSAQLATMTLNVTFNSAIGTEYVQVTDPVLIALLGLTANASGKYYTTINNVVAAASAALTAIGGNYTVAAGPARTTEGALQVFLNALNNNLVPTILSSASCAFVTPY
jgi:hypothetical protein